MNDVFFKALKRNNISVSADKTKARAAEIWENSDKKRKKELLDYAGHSMYHTVTKISGNGRITPQMAILLSRYLDANPFYLTGEADSRGNYSDGLLGEFLIKLGYGSLWRTYEKYITADDGAAGDGAGGQREIPAEKTNAGRELSDEAKREIEERFDKFARNVIKEAAAKYDREHKVTEAAASVVAEKPADISPAILRAANKLREDEILTLMRALLIRAKANSTASELAARIKMLLLMN